jgi:hypothetical protein
MRAASQVNATAERLIDSIRRECLNHLIVVYPTTAAPDGTSRART